MRAGRGYVLAELGHSPKRIRPLTVVGYGATIATIKLTTEIAYCACKAGGDSLGFNVLIGAVVIGGVGWTCLRKDGVAGRSAPRAGQAFRPLVAVVHLPLS
jgi:hypothetical protein